MSLAKIKKGDQVAMLSFTRMNLGVFKVTAANEKSITVTNAKGAELVFSRKTGRQTNVAEGKEKYANAICLPEDAPENKPRGAAKKVEKPAKKAAKVVEPEDDEDDEDDEPAPPKKSKVKAKPEPEEDDEEEEDDEPAPPKKPAKPTKKGSKKKPVEDDDDDFEDV